MLHQKFVLLKKKRKINHVIYGIIFMYSTDTFVLNEIYQKERVNIFCLHHIINVTNKNTY